MNAPFACDLDLYKNIRPHLLPNGFGCFLIWCGQRDLNSYSVKNTPLKRARMPIPPWPQMLRNSMKYYNGKEENCQLILQQ